MFVMFSDKSIIACNTTQGIFGKEEYSVRNFCELFYQEKKIYVMLLFFHAGFSHL